MLIHFNKQLHLHLIPHGMVIEHLSYTFLISQKWTLQKNNSFKTPLEKMWNTSITLKRIPDLCTTPFPLFRIKTCHVLSKPETIFEQIMPKRKPTMHKINEGIEKEKVKTVLKDRKWGVSGNLSSFLSITSCFSRNIHIK